MSITDRGRSPAAADVGTERSTGAGPHVGTQGAALSHAMAAGALGGSTSATSWVRNFASHDWLLVGYLLALLVALALGTGPHREPCMVRVSADLGLYLFVIALVRGPVLRWGSTASSLVYRTAAIGT